MPFLTTIWLTITIQFKKNFTFAKFMQIISYIKSVNKISILTVIKIFWSIWTCIIADEFLLAGDVNYKSSKVDDLFESDEERPATGRVIFKNRADTNSFVVVI